MGHDRMGTPPGFQQFSGGRFALQKSDFCFRRGPSEEGQRSQRRAEVPAKNGEVPAKEQPILSPAGIFLPTAAHSYVLISIDDLHGAAKNPDARCTIMTLTGHGR